MTARIDTIVLKGMTNLSPLLDKDVVDEDAYTSTLLPPRCIVCFLPSLFIAFVIVIGYELFVLFTIFDFFDFTVDDAVDDADEDEDEDEDESAFTLLPFLLRLGGYSTYKLCSRRLMCPLVHCVARGVNNECVVTQPPPRRVERKRR